MGFADLDETFCEVRQEVISEVLSAIRRARER